MVLNGYNYNKKSFKKVDLNNPFYKQNVVPKDLSHKQRKKSKEKTFIRDRIKNHNHKEERS